MGTSVKAYLAFLLAVAGLRMTELFLSRRNQRRLLGLGAQKVRDPGFPAMLLLHTGILCAAELEVITLARPLLPWLAAGMAAIFLATSAVRWWVIRTLAGRWSVQVLTPSQLGIVTGGPFRHVRHPNYAAVYVEMIAIPLVHTAWLTALAGALAHLFVLRARVRLEESVLLADPDYRAAMGSKPRFVPRLF